MRRNTNRRGSNLSHAARVRGGKHSAATQVRDENGQFAGKSTMKSVWHGTKRAFRSDDY